MTSLKACRVLVTPTSYGRDDPRLRSELEAVVGEVIYNPTSRPLLSTELVELLPGCHGYIAGLDYIDRAALHAADKVVAVNRSQPRLDHMKEMVGQFKTDIQIEYILNSDPHRNDEIMAALPEGSIVVNATGMGKDIPGSPITNAGQFPKNGIAWEFNYRGELDFMHQALRQVASRNITVEDGWVYFLHGWSQVVAQVLHIDLTNEIFTQLDAAAASTRG